MAPQMVSYVFQTKLWSTARDILFDLSSRYDVNTSVLERENRAYFYLPQQYSILPPLVHKNVLILNICRAQS